MIRLYPCLFFLPHRKLEGIETHVLTTRISIFMWRMSSSSFDPFQTSNRISCADKMPGVQGPCQLEPPKRSPRSLLLPTWAVLRAFLSAVCRSAATASPPVRAADHRSHRVKAAQEADWGGRGALALALTGVIHLRSRTEAASLPPGRNPNGGEWNECLRRTCFGRRFPLGSLLDLLDLRSHHLGFEFESQ